MSNTEQPMVHLTVTTEQAAALVSALDLFVRMGLGQLEEVASLVRFGVIAPRLAEGAPRGQASAEACERIEALAHAMKAELGHPRNSSFGIGHPHVPLEGARAYEVMKVVERALAVHRDPEPKFRGVNYDGLLVRYTADPAPEAEVTAGPRVTAQAIEEAVREQAVEALFHMECGRYEEGSPERRAWNEGTVDAAPVIRGMPSLFPGVEVESEAGGLPAAEWRELLDAVMRELKAKGHSKDGNAPGHAHTVPGVWDADNKKGLAGKPCAWCALWNKATAALEKSKGNS